MINYTANYTDLYELTMAQVYFETGRKDETAVFDYFFRKLPFDGGYAVFAGLDDLLTILEELHFDEKDMEFLSDQDFPEEFLEYLQDFRFKGTIYAAAEGDLIFPTRPVVQVEASIIEAQIIETLLLNILNFQTLIATKASRMKQVAGDGKLVDFGLRRAQGPGGYYAARAAVIGGFDATSNVVAARDFNIEPSGTMGHSFVQSYDDELSAFRDFAKYRAHDCVLLVDTYDTLKSGLPNAIKVGREMEARGERLKGVRLDSGDLAYLARKSRRMLDDAGLDYVKIAASNQLDEYVIKSLKEQQAPIDYFGVGTSLVTGRPDAALDGVYKLSQANGQPRIKLSESIQKINLPGKKQVFRIANEEGNWIGADIVALRDEKTFEMMYHPFESNKSMNIKDLQKFPVLEKVMESGKRLIPGRPLEEIAAFRKKRFDQLPFEYRRFENPHIYKIGISAALREQRNKLISNYKIKYK